MEHFTKRDWVMVRDALRWFSDQQEQAAEKLPPEAEDAKRLSAEFNAWRRGLANDIETAHQLK